MTLNNPAFNHDQFHSRLCVDQTNGFLVVTHQDPVADSGRTRTHVYFQTSNDDGVTGSAAVQVTSGQSDESSGADANQYGDYDGLHGHAGIFFPTWTDSRSGVEERWTSRLSLVPKQCQFILERSSCGQDEVQALLAQSSPRRFRRPSTWCSTASPRASSGSPGATRPAPHRWPRC